MTQTFRIKMPSFRKTLVETSEAALPKGNAKHSASLFVRAVGRRTYPVSIPTAQTGAATPKIFYIDPNSPAFKARVLARLAKEDELIELEIRRLNGDQPSPKDLVTAKSL